MCNREIERGSSECAKGVVERGDCEALFVRVVDYKASGPQALNTTQGRGNGGFRQADEVCGFESTSKATFKGSAVQSPRSERQPTKDKRQAARKKLPLCIWGIVRNK